MTTSSKTPETDAFEKEVMADEAAIDFSPSLIFDFARSLERRLREAEATLDAAGVAKGAFGHSIRYRIGLLIERAEAAEQKGKES